MFNKGKGVNKLSIEKLEDIKNGFVNNDNAGHYQSDMLDIALFMQYSVDLFKDLITDLQQFNKELRCREDFEKRIKKLEQAQTFYPTEEEIKNIKIGGTD